MFRVAGVGESHGPDLGEGLQAHVPALLGPLLGLANEERAHEADNGATIPEDAHNVGAATDLLVTGPR
jgi:hypothetical protein